MLAKLKPIGGPDATHTAGNAPGVNDGAGAVVVASEEWAKREGRPPLARVLSYGTVADDFAYLARTPAGAAKQALEKIGRSPSDVDLWEINEAFASVAINSVRMLGVDEEKVNVNGGAIALGHPIGASGARIVGALVHELRRRGGGVGCAAICSGGGQGDAIVLEVNGALGSRRSVGRIAAFFDLDRTLMAGSSGMHFARAAYRSGMVSRARLARWGAEHVRFRLRGSTDERTAQVLSQVKELLAGVPERDIERMGARSPGGGPAAHLPEDARRGARAPGRGSRHLHRQRRGQRPGGDAGAGARHGRRHRNPLRGRWATAC